MKKQTIKFKNTEEQDADVKLENREIEIVTTEMVEKVDKETLTLFDLDLKISNSQTRLTEIDTEKEKHMANIAEWEDKKEKILKQLK